MATVLDKELKRKVTVDGADYVVAFDPEGIRLTGKGKRKPEVELRWRDLLNGEAAMAVALNASLSMKAQPARQASAPAPAPATAAAAAPVPAPVDSGRSAAETPRKKRAPRKNPAR